jgi:hypothetical protein
MHRRLRSVVAALACGLVGVAPAAADEDAAAAAASSAKAAARAPVAVQELGATIGLRAGGRTTPGGFRAGGVYLYRITGKLWSESTLAFTVGGGSAACFRDRADDVVCDHGALAGRSVALSSGVRWVLAGKQGVVPFLRAGLGLELVSYGVDEVRGLAVPVQVGGGARGRVADRVALVGSAELHAGIGWFSRGIGTEPQAALVVTVGAELALD